MATRRTQSEAAILEQYRVALENVEKQPQIAAIMTEFGYGPETVAEGKTMLAATRQSYETNKTEDDETSEAYKLFDTKKEELSEIYSTDRKKAKVVFRNEPLTLERLGISGTTPRAYVRWLETVKTFYSEALVDETIKNKLARLQVTPDGLNAANALIGELESARAGYLLEKGESQEATKTKDAAFSQLDDWMRDFYDVARIALDENPQLLEALGLLVRS
jgi:hypothetical protein